LSVCWIGRTANFLLLLNGRSEILRQFLICERQAGGVECGAEHHIVLDHGVGDVEIRHGVDDTQAEAFIAAAVNKYTADDIILARWGATLQAIMFHNGIELLAVVRRDSLHAFSLFRVAHVSHARSH